MVPAKSRGILIYQRIHIGMDICPYAVPCGVSVVLEELKTTRDVSYGPSRKGKSTIL